MNWVAGLFWLQAGSTWIMVGIIWFVQIVHYPLFSFAGRVEFPMYEHEHRRRTTWVVLPPILLIGVMNPAIVLRSICSSNCRKPS